MIARALAVVAAISLGSCSWFDDGPPGRSCRITRDCFQAQGEVCDQASHTCVLSVDGGVIDATLAGAPP